MPTGWAAAALRCYYGVPTLFLEFLGDGGKQEPPESVLRRGLLTLETRNHWFEQNESRSV
ncbi:hypothetical protein [Coleofasciculus sp. FACHB-SPT9]|uniref:hypothetical protein n=1 Tax=Coleofasciculus sp. FACHB-SPT9 TaxID=2692791 RepID=UPI0016841D81|nr:hypothetical protein [Coleofasciculus sp. FACHB-SPT9]